MWPGIKKDALSWARECLACQRAKIHRHTRLPPTNIDVPDQRFSHVHLDLIVLPEVDNYRYCLTIIDYFSRWPQAVPLRDIRAETVASAFYSSWISIFGTPLTITTNQGAQFESALFSALARLVGANKVHTTPYHPQSNGILERWHRTLKAVLMCHPHDPWATLLPSTSDSCRRYQRHIMSRRNVSTTRTSAPAHMCSEGWMQSSHHSHHRTQAFTVSCSGLMISVLSLTLMAQ